MDATYQSGAAMPLGIKKQGSGYATIPQFVTPQKFFQTFLITTQLLVGIGLLVVTFAALWLLIAALRLSYSVLDYTTHSSNFFHSFFFHI